MQNGMIRFEATKLCAGVVIENGLVVREGGGLGFMHGWTEQRCIDFGNKRRWVLTMMPDKPTAERVDA